MTDCIFCKITKKEIPAKIIYEDEHTIAFLDIKPISRGHTLVIPKKHYDDLDALDLKESQQLISTVKKIGANSMNKLGAEAYNVGVNNGRAAGQIIFHLHFHIIPRFNGDGLKSWENHDTSEEELNEVFQKLKQ